MHNPVIDFNRQMALQAQNASQGNAQMIQDLQQQINMMRQTTMMQQQISGWQQPQPPYQANGMPQMMAQPA